MFVDHRDFLERCCAGLDGVVVTDGAFSPGPAIWVGRREAAHFDGAQTLDVRLTKRLVWQRRAELRSDHRIALRPGSSDWVEVTIGGEADRSIAEGLVGDAIEANRSTAPAGAPPSGPELDRRRRFH
jgi:hypothetical protein